jgi:oligopeptide/dipeptide ABC transporter ATP-binding protein
MVQLFIGSCTGKLRVLSLSFVLLFLCGSFSLHSAHAASLKDIYQQAQENDPTFLSASFQKKVIEEGRKQAIANYLPTLAASADYTDTSQDIISSDNEVFGSGQSDFTTTAYKLTLTQPIFRWDSIVGLKQSKAENLRAAAEYALAEQSLILRVADLYLQALAAQDLVNLAMAELASTEKLYQYPAHPYTRALLSAIPHPDPELPPIKIDILPGELPSATEPPPGCRFHTRCPRAQANCSRETPDLQEIDSGHQVACHYPHLEETGDER